MLELSAASGTAGCWNRNGQCCHECRGGGVLSPHYHAALARLCLTEKTCRGAGGTRILDRSEGVNCAVSTSPSHEQPTRISTNTYYWHLVIK
ncbi:hypothetical protein O3P69_000411 [Scylla paramamosain]|uniref:Uncharacterized protein n=1 Tax=Scylla paramamosain TaxID=85552 RepID=A0AAW0UVL1_SCYPA